MYIYIYIIQEDYCLYVSDLKFKNGWTRSQIRLRCAGSPRILAASPRRSAGSPRGSDEFEVEARLPVLGTRGLDLQASLPTSSKSDVDSEFQFSTLSGVSLGEACFVSSCICCSLSKSSRSCSWRILVTRSFMCALTSSSRWCFSAVFSASLLALRIRSSFLLRLSFSLLSLSFSFFDFLRTGGFLNVNVHVVLSASRSLVFFRLKRLVYLWT